MCMQHTPMLRKLDLRTLQSLSHTCKAARQAAHEDLGALQMLASVCPKQLSSSCLPIKPCSDASSLQAQLLGALDTAALSRPQLCQEVDALAYLHACVRDGRPTLAWSSHWISLEMCMAAIVARTWLVVYQPI